MNQPKNSMQKRTSKWTYAYLFLAGASLLTMVLLYAFQVIYSS